MPRTREQAELDTVRSRPGRAGYHAPTLAAVDKHLANLATGLNAGSLTDAGRTRVLEDIDALLSRRLYLTTMEAS